MTEKKVKKVILYKKNCTMNILSTFFCSPFCLSLWSYNILVNDSGTKIKSWKVILFLRRLLNFFKLKNFIYWNNCKLSYAIEMSFVFSFGKSKLILEIVLDLEWNFIFCYFFNLKKSLSLWLVSRLRLLLNSWLLRNDCYNLML